MGDRPIRGYALTGIVCVGALACGPEKVASEAGETAGYPLDTGDTGGTGETETETETETGTDYPPTPECEYRGDICGEMSVCMCDCDYSSDCCSCASVECTNASHCADDEFCDFETGWGPYQCTPIGSCVGSTHIVVEGDADPADYEGKTCADSLRLEATTWVEIAGFEQLEAVNWELQILNNPQLANLDGFTALTQVGNLEIADNAALISMQGLAGLQSIQGTIQNNPLLPTADVEAMLAQIPGGENVIVCGNLDGEPC